MKGTKKKFNLRKFGIAASSLALCACLSVSAVLPSWQTNADAASGNAVTAVNTNKLVNKIESNKIDNHIEDYYDTSVVYKLPDTVKSEEEISIIVQLNEDAILDEYNKDAVAQRAYSIGEYALTKEGYQISAGIQRENEKLQRALSKAGVQYSVGVSYDVVFGGFEITTKAKNFEKICDVLEDKATVIVGEVYEKCETQVVTNDVKVYDTGIFDSSDSQYDGSGVVIAVLDSGLDYTHSAFDVSRFTGDEVLTRDNLKDKIGNFRASQMTAGLTAEDVYVSKKIPFAYDYADGDSDVFPISSEHGTHVSGIIVGNDDEIMGVAPNAQLAFFKVFSDTHEGARSSWLISALEDCVLLGVDVANLSLGTSCGYSREVDKIAVQSVYDKIGEQGISLVVAGSNSYNSTFGSTKNGNLGLTSNPDTATVGSPSTYDSALSVASVSGVKTPYLTSSVTGDMPIYIKEGSGVGAVLKDFVKETLTATQATDSVSLEYVVVPGIGRMADYNGVDVAGKIALVRRGSTNFEDKALIAKQKGAIACIIYNNVSGEISMSVGAVGNYPVCSISQDDGERLVAAGGGTITVNANNLAGPFMSDFSSWGPTPSLGIKPEITAHGGDILSCVPGQAYDRQSGTSMASPNQAGITALIRQYVKEHFPNLTNVEVNAMVNQLVMSTADIVYNKNGLAYAVRKQGAGLSNLANATSTPAYLRTYDQEGNVMDKTKLELGDDKDKTGVYEMSVEVVNISSSAVSYDVKAIVMTEGVSKTLTNKGLTTVTEEGYTLDGASISVTGNGVSGTNVTVAGNSTQKINVKITLSAEDKAYLDASFENGMYVEGFIRLVATGGTQINLSVPYLAFYGDWTQAPLFDIDYFETNRDELDDSIDTLDKTLPDAFATTPLGGQYNDYVVQLGSYAFEQNPSATKIAATREHIALSNQATGDDASTVHSIYSVYAGMLRGAKRVEIQVTNDVTGEVLYTETIYNQRKSYSSGSSIYPSPVDLDFDLADYDLKNNTQYTFKMTGYLDYGDGGIDTNVRNTFTFPFTVDFQAPTLEDVTFRSEYDEDKKSYRLFADMAIYDNHYTQAAIIGYIYPNEEGQYQLDSFGRYITPVYSTRNATSILTYELTDYLEQIKQSYNGNSFIVQAFDYAHNTATYEVSIPDNIAEIIFEKDGQTVEKIELGINETFSLNEIVQVLPDTSWVSSLSFSTKNEKIARVVNGNVIGLSAGTTDVVVSSLDGTVKKSIPVIVDGEKVFDKPVAESFVLKGYKVNKVFQFTSSTDRDLGTNDVGAEVDFSSNNYSLKMYPSESVTLIPRLYAYYEKDIKLDYVSTNPNVAKVSSDGTITALKEGAATVSVRVLMKNSKGEYASTLYTRTVSIEVKDPYVVTAIYLTSYFGLGGEVIIPDDLGITEISAYAFSNYEYVPKGEGDYIDEEDPYATKQSYLGESTIERVVIPEGVEVISGYAFAGLTALKEVVLPSTLTKIQYGAFYNCTALTSVKFSSQNNLQFINYNAFAGCTRLKDFSFSSIVAIGDEAFAMSGISQLRLPSTAQSIGIGAFYGCTNLSLVNIGAEKVKLGHDAFGGCTALTTLEINASVIPVGTFSGCSALTTVKLGKDVSVIGQGAFYDTFIETFEVDSANTEIKASADGKAILSADGKTLVLVAPLTDSYANEEVTSIADGAFSSARYIGRVSLPGVTKVGDYAFAKCEALEKIELGELTEVGYAAFYSTMIDKMPTLSAELTQIGDLAFYGTFISEVNIANGVQVGASAFAYCPYLEKVVVGDDVVLGSYAFMAAVNSHSGIEYFMTEDGIDYYMGYTAYYTVLKNVTVGNNVTIGAYAFLGANQLKKVTLGEGTKIGESAFYNCTLLDSVDLSKVKSIGSYAFSGDRTGIYYINGQSYEFVTYLDLITVENEILNTFFAPKLTKVDLSSCERLGAYSFTATPLKSVVLGENLISIGEGAFYKCVNLTTVDLGGAKKIGVSAFADTRALKNVDASNVEEIGNEAFVESGLESITLKEGVKIGDNVFRTVETLKHAINVEKASVIGAYAFAYTGLEKIDLTAVEEVGNFAFAFVPATEVVFGENVKKMGENPFQGIEFGAYERAGATTFTVGENVKVIDGVMYRVAANGGLELVSYPIGLTQSEYEVAKETVRIGAGAFYNSKLMKVTLDVYVSAIGDKAFYGCENLAIVVFKSNAAPILEEQYDAAYLDTANPETGIPNKYYRAPFKGEIELTDGTIIPALGIVAYNMWNWESYVTFYYGANFIDMIGEKSHEERTLIMVRPSNGTGYNTFIYNEYFDSQIDGMTAPEKATLAVIEMIQALPTTGVTLNDKEAIYAAKAAYDALTTVQQALLFGAYDGTNYNSTLQSLLNTISFLENQQGGGNEGGGANEGEIPAPVENSSNVGFYVAIGVLSAGIVALGATVVVLIMKRKNL